MWDIVITKPVKATITLPVKEKNLTGLSYNDVVQFPLAMA